MTKNAVLHKDQLWAGSVLIFLNLVHYFPHLMIVNRYPPELFLNFCVDFFVPMVVIQIRDCVPLKLPRVCRIFCASGSFT